MYVGALGSTNSPLRLDFATTWLNRSAIWAVEFMPYDSWTSIQGPNWLLSDAQSWLNGDPDNRILVLSVPLLPGYIDASGYGVPTAGTLADGAAGLLTSNFQTLGQRLGARILSNGATMASRTIIRLAWEFNGIWYPWRVLNTTEAQNFATYWSLVVPAMKSQPGASGLRFCWNGVPGYTSYSLATSYPGNAYVDFVGLDLYDSCYLSDTYPIPAGATQADIKARRDRAWSDNFSSGHNPMVWWRDFSITQGKPFCLPEWGLMDRSDGHGGKDNPFFIQQMSDFIHDPQNNVSWHAYFNYNNSTANSKIVPYSLDPTLFPESQAVFLRLFTASGQLSPLQYEGEATYTAAPKVSTFSDTNASGGTAVKLDATAINDSVNFTLPNVPAGSYNVKIRARRNNNRGLFQLTVDGVNQGTIQDQYSVSGVWEFLDLGVKTFSTTANHVFQMKVTGKTGGSYGYTLTCDTIVLDPLTYDSDRTPNAVATDSVTLFTDASTSGGTAEKLEANAANDYITYPIPNVPAGTYTIQLRAKTHPTRGKFQLSIDGVNQGTVQDQYASTAAWVIFNLGSKTFSTPGNHTFTFTVTGKNAASSGYNLTFDTITVAP